MAGLLSFTFLRNGAALLCACLIASGCATHTERFAETEQLLLTGQPMRAIQALDQTNERSREPVLYYMNRGMLERIAGNYESSNQSLEKALKKIESVQAISVTENILSFTVNDSQISFRGEPFEQVMIHLIMALNYLDLGKLDDARVEAQRLDIKLKEVSIADDYDSYREDAFARYLTGMIYEALDEPDNALIAYRKALQTYQAQTKHFSVPVPNSLKLDLWRMAKKLGLDNDAKQWAAEFALDTSFDDSNKGQIIAIVADGLAPKKIENSITHFSPLNKSFFRIALPKYVSRPLRLNGFSLHANESSASSELVENIDAMARDMLDAQKPEILARAVARQVAKNELNQKAKDENKLFGAIMQISSIVNERADTRAWTTLPSGFLMARLFVDPGEYEISLNLHGRSQSFSKTSVRAGETVFITHHWLSPNLAFAGRR